MKQAILLKADHKGLFVLDNDTECVAEVLPRVEEDRSYTITPPNGEPGDKINAEYGDESLIHTLPLVTVYAEDFHARMASKSDKILIVDKGPSSCTQVFIIQDITFRVVPDPLKAALSNPLAAAAEPGTYTDEPLNALPNLRDHNQVKAWFLSCGADVWFKLCHIAEKPTIRAKLAARAIFGPGGDAKGALRSRFKYGHAGHVFWAGVLGTPHEYTCALLYALIDSMGLANFVYLPGSAEAPTPIAIAGMGLDENFFWQDSRTEEPQVILGSGVCGHSVADYDSSAKSLSDLGLALVGGRGKQNPLLRFITKVLEFPGYANGLKLNKTCGRVLLTRSSELCSVADGAIFALVPDISEMRARARAYCLQYDETL